MIACLITSHKSQCVFKLETFSQTDYAFARIRTHLDTINLTVLWHLFMPYNVLRASLPGDGSKSLSLRENNRQSTLRVSQFVNINGV